MNVLPINLKKTNYGINFVLKALAGKKESREVLKYVCANEDKLIATDNKRLHIYQDEIIKEIFFESGVYDLAFQNKETFIIKKDLQYPDYKTWIPDDKYHDFILNIEDCSPSITKAVVLLSKKAESQNYCINYDYVKDLAGFEWTLTNDMATERSYKLISGKLTAVIMAIDLTSK